MGTYSFAEMTKLAGYLGGGTVSSTIVTLEAALENKNSC